MTPVPPMAQRPSESMPGVLPSGCRADGARSTWILGTAFGTSGGAGEEDDSRGTRNDRRIHGLPPPSVEHLHGLRLIALGASEKPAELLARLLLICGDAS